MIVSFELDDLITPPEQAELQARLGDDPEALKRFCQAAVTDLADTVFNRRPPGRLNDVDQRRLLHIILHAFPNGLPSETQIQSLFYVGRSRASAMLRNLDARESAALKDHYKKTVLAVFSKKSTERNGAFEVRLTSRFVADWLKEIAERTGSGLKPITKVPATNDVYAIPTDVYKNICKDLGITPP